LLNRTSIDQRPSIVNERERVGDIEVDLMMGKNHKGAVLVMTDRATLQTRLRKLSSKESSEVLKGITDALNTNPYKALTLTFDNDKAFSCHSELARKMELETYFTRPYTSQDKGTVENRIGVLRRFLPKKTNLSFVSEKMLNEIESKLNNRPVRKFNYQTPQQVLLKKIALIT
jgi:IS30 family transposase